ncbi:hypothetical protein C8R46DRAFT_1125160 [Mycena filopes]|nr:hypothetical protein C8R46DRAFT_1125160 [Mycena filopes]
MRKCSIAVHSCMAEFFFCCAAAKTLVQRVNGVSSSQATKSEVQESRFEIDNFLIVKIDARDHAGRYRSLVRKGFLSRNTECQRQATSWNPIRGSTVGVLTISGHKKKETRSEGYRWRRSTKRGRRIRKQYRYDGAGWVETAVLLRRQ